MISISLDHDILHFVLCPWICFSVSWFIVYGSLNRICILLLGESCINLAYVELAHSAFQVCFIFLLFCLFILIFKSLIVKVAQSCLTLQPHELYSPWNSPGQNTGVCRLSLLQGIFPTQGLNPGVPHCRQILYQMSHQGNPNSN